MDYSIIVVENHLSIMNIIPRNFSIIGALVLVANHALEKGLLSFIGQPLHLPCLFVCIEVKDYVPNRLNRYADALANPIKYQQVK